MVTRLSAFVDLEVDCDFGQRQGVAEGDEVGRALGGHDAGDAGRGEYVAFGDGAVADGGEGGGGHVDAAFGDGFAGRGVLVADIDHGCAAVFVEVGQLCHCCERMSFTVRR